MARVLDQRQHVRVHSGMPEHPKVEALSDGAFRCLIEAWCLCRRTGNDGRIPVAVWTKRWKAPARKQLLAAGLAEIEDDIVVMHDWLEHQPSAAELDSKRAVRAEAGRRGGKRSAERRSQIGSRATANPEAIASHENGNGEVTFAKNDLETDARAAHGDQASNQVVSDTVETLSPATTFEAGQANASELLDHSLQRSRSKIQPDKDIDIDSGYVGRERYVSNAREFADENPPPRHHPEHPDSWVPGCAQCHALAGAAAARAAAAVVAERGPDATPPPPTCPAHPHGTTEPCHACGAARRTRAVWESARAQAAAEQAAAERDAAVDARRQAIAACPLGCAELDGYLDDGNGSRALCDHRAPNPSRPTLREQYEQHKRAAEPPPADTEEPDHG